MDVSRDTEEIKEALNKAFTEKYGDLGMKFIITTNDYHTLTLGLVFDRHPVVGKFHNVTINDEVFGWIYDKLTQLTGQMISAIGHQFFVHRLDPKYYAYDPSGGAGDYKKLRALVESLKTQGFTCEGGPLINTVEFRELSSRLGVELPPLEGGVQDED